jgi:ArsR family transcriptional regulator
MNDRSLSGLAAQLSALSHPARLEILTVLAANERCCCKDVVGHLDLAQSTVSQHLKVLVEAGLVRLKPDGQRSLYAIDRTAIAGLSQRFCAMLDTCCAGPGQPCAL